MSEEQSQPELFSLQVLKPATFAFCVSLQDLVARSSGVQRSTSTLILRARDGLRVLSVDGLGNNWSGMDIFAFAKEALGGVRLLLCHVERLFVVLFTKRASRKSQVASLSAGSGAFRSQRERKTPEVAHGPTHSVGEEEKVRNLAAMCAAGSATFLHRPQLSTKEKCWLDDLCSRRRSPHRRG